MTPSLQTPPPTFHEEQSLWNSGHRLVAGLDEVGRGPIAGPVVAGVAILPQRLEGDWAALVRDSKQLTAAQREAVLPHLEETAVGLAVGVGSVEEIDALGIMNATRLAMRRALEALTVRPDFLLLDAFPLPGVATPQKAIVHGDALCLSIAAASIAAKVARDRMMVELDGEYPGYGFASHKGYASSDHLARLRELGPCAIHRFGFEPVRGFCASLGITPRPKLPSPLRGEGQDGGEDARGEVLHPHLSPPPSRGRKKQRPTHSPLQFPLLSDA
ncbi:MAG: ribonuclease HII [SAR202 cluster bacterium]|nr:ribonuclease HII [SAR202 cluster bacterium]